MLLGSASGPLLHQSAESLAGRVAYLELTPFLLDEVTGSGNPPEQAARLWLRGGFPRSFLAADDMASIEWRYDSRRDPAHDLPQAGSAVTNG